jgi:hypothetical protein
LTIAGLSVPASKVYDSTETATVSGTAALQTAETPGTGTSVDGIPYSSDNIMLSGSPIGTYNSPTVAGATTVTISGLSLAGTQVADYSLVPDAFSATITRLPITLTGSRTYNNTAIAKASILTISDDLDGLNLTLSGQATLLSASTGVEPIINFASLSLGGSAENNYTLTGASGSVTILPGGPPVANATNIYHAVGTAIQISVTNLLFLSTSDTNGDPVDLVSVAGGLLTNDSQIAITTNGSSVYYANPYQNSSYIVLGPANNNLTTYVSGETIQYVVEDGNFKTPLYMATNYINIIVTNAAGQGTGSIAVSGGSVVLSWAGIPYTTNVTQRSSLMNGPWTNIFTNIVPQAGLFTNIDTDPPQPTAFYQLQQY